MAKKKKKLFEIDKDSIIKGTAGGYQYVCTIPPHKYGEVRGDRNKRYVYLHRAIYESEVLGRYLKPNEQIDHKDGDKSNNAPSNLVLKLHGEHQRDHANNGNSFWKKSPLNKPGVKRKAHRVIYRFLGRNVL